jgi:hypothetical protein
VVHLPSFGADDDDMHSLMERSLFAALILGTFGVLGTVMALRPHRANLVRMHLPGQGESPDWYIRLIGVVVGLFSVSIAVVLVFIAK